MGTEEIISAQACRLSVAAVMNCLSLCWCKNTPRQTELCFGQNVSFHQAAQQKQQRRQSSN